MQLNLGSRNDPLKETFQISAMFVQFFLVVCKSTVWQLCKYLNLGFSLTVIPGATDMKIHNPLSYDSTIINMAKAKKL